MILVINVAIFIFSLTIGLIITALEPSSTQREFQFTDQGRQYGFSCICDANKWRGIGSDNCSGGENNIDKAIDIGLMSIPGACCMSQPSMVNEFGVKVNLRDIIIKEEDKKNFPECS